MNALNRRILPVALLCCALAMSAAAQEAPQAQGTRKDPQTAKPSTVTIVGCLVQGDAAGKSDAGSANANDFFIRTPAITVPIGSSVSVGDPQTTASGRATTSAGAPVETAMYRITGLDREQLRPHVGHRVELQGHLSGNTPAPPVSAASPPAGDTTTRAATAAAARAAAVAGVLHATTLKMVAASCK